MMLDGDRWTVVPLDDPYIEQLHDGAGVGDELWVAGSRRATDASDGFATGVVLHFDGASWQAIEEPTMPVLADVFVGARDDIWFAGGGYLGPSDVREPCLWHWDGASWTVRDADVNDGQTVYGVRRLWGASSTDVWALVVDTENGDPDVFHFDGTSWTRRGDLLSVVDPSRRDASSILYLFDACSLSASDVWVAAGITREDPAAPSQGLLFHWDGTAWTATGYKDCAFCSFSSIACDPSGPWVQLWDELLVETFVEQWDGASWRRVDIPNEATGTNASRGFTALGLGTNSDLWVAESILWPVPAVDEESDQLWHIDDGEASPTFDRDELSGLINSLWTSDSGTTFAFGQDLLLR